MRVAILGDVHGYLDPLVDVLTRLGIDPARDVWPDNLMVIQLGDQVHRGPDSAGVVSLIAKLVERFPGRMLDVVGNHETAYLSEHDPGGTLITDEIRAVVLSRSAPRNYAIGVKTRSGDQIMTTHAGITWDWWNAYTPGITDVTVLAQRMGAMWDVDDPVCTIRGLAYIHDGRTVPNFEASPVFAHTGNEVVPSWVNAEVDPPFDQVVGHSGFIWWDDDFAPPPDDSGPLTMWHDHARRFSTAMFPSGRHVTCIDGHLYTQERPIMYPWMVDDVVEVATTSNVYRYR